MLCTGTSAKLSRAEGKHDLRTGYALVRVRFCSTKTISIFSSHLVGASFAGNLWSIWLHRLQQLRVSSHFLKSITSIRADQHMILIELSSAWKVHGWLSAWWCTICEFDRQHYPAGVVHVATTFKSHGIKRNYSWPKSLHTGVLHTLTHSTYVIIHQMCKRSNRLVKGGCVVERVSERSHATWHPAHLMNYVRNYISSHHS